LPVSFWGIIVLFFLMAYPFFIGHEKISDKSSNAEDLSFKKVAIAEVAAKSPPWQIWAESAQISKESGTAALSKIKGVFYKKDKPLFYLSAPSGILEINSQSFNLSLVKINDGKEYSLTSKELNFNQNEGIFNGQGNVELKGNFFRLQGENINIDSGFKRAILKGKTRCFIEIS
jgi:hypothetical protein